MSKHSSKKTEADSSKSKLYKRVYNPKWNKDPRFAAWIMPLDDDDCKAWCKICHTSIRAQKTDLVRHQLSNKHTRKCELRNPKIQQPIDQAFVVKGIDEQKAIDITLSAYVASHSSINAIDHLSDLLTKYSPGAKFEKLRLKRTKCSSILLNILEPVFRSNLMSDIGKQPFSIILDESTDVTTDKYMAYCVRYFNEDLDDIVTDFLGLQVVYRATAKVLHTAFKEFLSCMGLSLGNLIGLGTDGAPALCSVVNKKNEDNSLFTLLKAEIPNLQLLKCVCHSLHKCSEKAMEELPSSIEFLLRETRNWFAHSTVRQLEYFELYSNVCEKPHKLTQLSDTRWLVLEKAVQNILTQWEPLKQHFHQLVNSPPPKKPEKCYTARTLSSMFNDSVHYLYLKFLSPILKEISNLNVKFQAERADAVKLYSELRTLLLSLARQIFKPSFLKNNIQNTGSTGSLSALHEEDIRLVNYAMDHANREFGSSLLKLEDIDFGTEFQSAYEVLQSGTESKMSNADLLHVKQKCLNFLKRLITEIIERLPNNVQVITKLNCFNPYVSLDKGSSRPKASDLPWDLASPNCDREAIEMQWQKLRTLHYQEICGDKMTGDSIKFWVAVSKIRNAIGNQEFLDLSAFALRALSLPISNAVVERVFSVMSIIKTKLRNRMKMVMLNAILRIRLYMKTRNICCKTFVVTKNMCDLHNQNMYQRNATLPGSSPPCQNDAGVLKLEEEEEFQIFEEIITLYADLGS